MFRIALVAVCSVCLASTVATNEVVALSTMSAWKSHPRSAKAYRSRQRDGLSPNLMMSIQTRAGESCETSITPSFNPNIKALSSRDAPKPTQAIGIPTVLSIWVTSFVQFYSSSLVQRPIITKSLTAGILFAFSDFLAQSIENKNFRCLQLLNWNRLICGALVGLLYFGPAAHYWYDMIFRLFPSTSFLSTLQKAAFGQLVFGPSFTCLFFAVGLLQQGQFSLSTWLSKIRHDLPRAWLAGVGFWPLVDIISYSFVPKNWIPLFINACSLIWNIYLSLVANRRATGGFEESSSTG